MVTTLEHVLSPRQSVTDQPRPFSGVFTGTVMAMPAGGARVELDSMPGTYVGPMEYPGSTTPPLGTRCVVAFAGEVLAGAVIVAFLGWP